MERRDETGPRCRYRIPLPLFGHLYEFDNKKEVSFSMVPGLKERFLSSARNLVKTRTLTMAAMLMAHQIVL